MWGDEGSGDVSLSMSVLLLPILVTDKVVCTYILILTYICDMKHQLDPRHNPANQTKQSQGCEIRLSSQS